jgi:class 3 adenylate cyclase
LLVEDIAGFTAWSSVREPSQVFVLLETLYGAFDNIAKRRGVFKVETVGDCYVAATGLPEPCSDHAVVMARFARLCMEQMRRIVRALERSLGPDTAELAMRAGMHSGPVTAGVLRGDRSRFQLFGDTMNTAARMEQSGVKNRIQVTEATYRLLCAHGKSKWLVAREDKVSPKGKGEMVTYWLKPSRQFDDSILAQSRNHSSYGSNDRSSVSNSGSADTSKGKLTRLIDWNVQVLEELLKRIVARREVCQENDKTPPNEDHFKHSTISAIDEVREIINLPRFDERTLNKQRDPENIYLPTNVIQQLHQFVRNVASMYRDNPFHNFEHASHVLMSVYKLLNRIIAPDITCGLVRNELDGIDTVSNDSYNNAAKTYRKSFGGDDIDAAVLHDHTYGITSDPLTQFACVLSALIHDCDHPGVPNAQLIKENAIVAQQYKQQSCAEQNSIDLAWALLMSDDYIDLRNVLYQTDAELKRFRELVVNSVMATDIADKDLKALRNRRWDAAFNLLHDHSGSKLDAVNRKATIVIEHLIQASDVSHTMQHWHVYRKWNERFFMECYEAFVTDRADKDPSEYWYQGEMGFFDFYIIPLAKKLKDCGVFGISSDECLNYAIKNRQEWEVRGIEIVTELVEKAKRKHSELSCLQNSFAF